MKHSEKLKTVSVLLDETIKDAKEWEKAECRLTYGGYYERVGATKTGIQDRIKLIRAMLLQISKEVG